MSILLSRFLDREFHVGKEVVSFKTRNLVATEWLSNDDDANLHEFHTGSRSEGVHIKNSDIDIMYIDRLVKVLYPDQSISQADQDKTIFLIRKTENCRPGFVALELGNIGKKGRPAIPNSIVKVGRRFYISSDKFRYESSKLFTSKGIHSMPNGPSNTVEILTGIDSVICFPCDSWPREAEEWLSRSRLHGWPSERLLRKIRRKGCHLVPVGDKCFQNTLLQWRITFVTTERRLIHSLSHIQFQIYVLLKYFLKQIQGTLKDTIGDADILCSYFMKNLVFFAVENTHPMFWQERNLFYCFWFCFNMLIDWVRLGFCPNYFIPTNNMFQRKVHGQHQRMLMDILNNYHGMKWLCLSVGQCFPPIANSLFNDRTQAELLDSSISQDIDCNMDVTVMMCCRKSSLALRNPVKRMTKNLHLLSKSQKECDEVSSYCYAIDTLSEMAGQRVFTEITDLGQGNKARYRNIRKCKIWMAPWSSLGTNMLYQATFQFLLGDFRKSLEMCTEVIKLTSCFKCNVIHRSLEERAKYLKKYSGQGHDMLSRCKKEFIDILMFSKKEPWLCLPQLRPELSKCRHHLHVSPLPYALFLTFLCFHELGDTSSRDAALNDFIVVKYDKEQGGHLKKMVHTLLGICHQIAGNGYMAGKAFHDSKFAPIASNYP